VTEAELRAAVLRGLSDAGACVATPEGLAARAPLGRAGLENLLAAVSPLCARLGAPRACLAGGTGGGPA
jgi:hypothetical protein